MTHYWRFVRAFAAFYAGAWLGSIFPLPFKGAVEWVETAELVGLISRVILGALLVAMVVLGWLTSMRADALALPPDYRASEAPDPDATPVPPGRAR